MSANQTVPGSRPRADERLVRAVPLVATSVGEVVGPADDALADEDGGGDEPHLSQRPAGDGGRRGEGDGGGHGLARMRRAQQQHSGGRRHGGSMSQRGVGEGPRPQELAICQAQMCPLTCTNASGGAANPC